MTGEPDYTPRRGLDGRMFTKTRPMECPWCGDTFYVFQAEDNPQPPYENPEPHIGPTVAHGMRHVCDSPECWGQEQDHQVRRSPLYAKACADKYSTQSPEPVRITKGGGLQRVAS